MTSPRRSRRFDRRTISRRSRRIPALVGRKGATMPQCENGLIEDVDRSGAGVRLRAATELRPEDSLILYVGEKQEPMAAKVIWVRREGLIEKRRTGKPAQAFVAGCVVKGLEAPKPRRKRGPETDYSVLLMRALFAAGGLAGIGVLVYILVALFRLMR